MLAPIAVVSPPATNEDMRKERKRRRIAKRIKREESPQTSDAEKGEHIDIHA